MKKIFLGTAALLTGLTLQAQQNTTASGGRASGSGGTASYSVGQVAYSTNNGTNGTVTQGVQQPFEIFTVTGLHDIEGINLTILAYPNPITEYLTLEVEDYKSLTFTYGVYDMQGKLLLDEKVTAKLTQVQMSGLIPATYFIKITHENKLVKTFKIVKTQ